MSVSQPSGSELLDLPGEALLLDLEDRVELDRAVSGSDMVVHLAARAGGIQFQDDRALTVFSTNRQITDNLLASCLEANVARVFLASSLVTYRDASGLLQETHPQLRPSDGPSPYAWSKITDEVVASWHSDLNFSIGRFGNVYGPGAPFDPSRSTVVHALIDRAARLTDGADLVVWGDGTATRSFVFVKDAARAVLLTLSAGRPGESYNIDTGEPVTIAELAEVVRDQVNATLRLVFDDSKPAGTPYRVASIDKLASLGYAPATTLAEGIKATVDWYRNWNASV